jgi:hypothetical protein
MLRPFLFQWQVFLDTLGDRYWDENNNPAYKLFLGEGIKKSFCVS